MRALVIATERDSQGEIRFVPGWADRVAQGLGAGTTVLRGASAIPSTARPAFGGHDLVCFFGHGLDDAWLAQGSQPPHLLDVSSIGTCAGKHVFAFACRTANTLGPAASQAGCRVYVGYRTELKVPPLSDAENEIIGTAVAAVPSILSTGEASPVRIADVARESSKQARAALVRVGSASFMTLLLVDELVEELRVFPA